MTSKKPDTINECDSVNASFEQHVLPLRAELTRAALRLTKNGADAEDLVQDTLLRAYRHFETFDVGTNVRAWMHQILRNTWISRHRAAQRRLAEVLTGEFAEVAQTASAPTSMPEAEVIAAQPDNDVVAALAELNEEFRMVVYLADVEGYPYATIAEMMNTPIGTVMSRLHRARRLLRVSLGGAVRRRRLVAAA
ncbi:MAG: sigma-70 family RNA polymerase sigma factor [Mycobacterium sp.]